MHFVSGLSGQPLGALKVRRDAQLLTLRKKLANAMGGSCGFDYEIQLVHGTQIFDDPFATPFTEAEPGETFRVLKIPMSDAVYVDLDRKFNRMNW